MPNQQHQCIIALNVCIIIMVQYPILSIETVLLILPFLQTNITSQLWPRGHVCVHLSVAQLLNILRKNEPVSKQTDTYGGVRSKVKVAGGQSQSPGGGITVYLFGSSRTSSSLA